MTSLRPGLPRELLDLVVRALGDWDRIGPARATDEVAWLLGYPDAADLVAGMRELADALVREQPLASEDWRRVLGATELALASDVVGTGSEWTVIHGGTETEWFLRLRRLQALLGDALPAHD